MHGWLGSSVRRTRYPSTVEDLGERGVEQFVRRAITFGAAHGIDTVAGVTALLSLLVQNREAFERSPDRAWAIQVLQHATLPGMLKGVGERGGARACNLICMRFFQMTGCSGMAATIFSSPLLISKTVVLHGLKPRDRETERLAAMALDGAHLMVSSFVGCLPATTSCRLGRPNRTVGSTRKWPRL